MRAADARSRGRAASIALVALACASCGDSSSGAEVAVASPTTVQVVAPPTTSVAARGTSTTSPPEAGNRLEGSEDLWNWSGRIGEEEAEFTRTLSELVGIADVVVLGRVADVRLGRAVNFSGVPATQAQAAEVVVEVVRSTGDLSDDVVTFEISLPVSSPELTAAVEAAKNPVDSNGNGVLDDDELANGIDDEAIAAAFERYWDDAVEQSLARLIERVPDNDTLFFLRAIPTPSGHRLVNGASVIVNDAGLALLPFDGPLEETQPIARAVNGVPFDEVLAQVFHDAE